MKSEYVKKGIVGFILFCLPFLNPPLGSNTKGHPGIRDEPFTREELVEAFQDWRFGIFVHWGLSAGYGDDYGSRRDELAPDFFVQRGNNFEKLTTDFDAEEWITTFKEAGARYFTLVSRHSSDQFFCLYPTEVEDFHATRDYVGELSDACKIHGMPFFLYLAMADETIGQWREKGYPNPQEYVGKLNKKISALMIEYVNRYDVTGFWLDGWPGRVKRMKNAGLDAYEYFDFGEITAAVRKEQSNILIGNKEYFPPHIDFEASEWLFTTQLGEPLFGDEVPTEVTETMPASKHWFSIYNRDESFLSETELQYQSGLFIKRLVSINGRAINYLLNVGPLLSGKIHHQEKKMLENIGNWFSRNGESIYSTRLGPLEQADWGYNLIRGNKIFLHIIDNRDIVNAVTLHKIRDKAEIWQKTGMPDNKRIELKGLNGKIKKLHLLNSNKNIPYSWQTDRVILDMQEVGEDPLDTIVVIELEDK